MTNPIETLIVILNYNNPKDTINCLESLGLSDARQCKIALYDDVSTDQSAQILSSYIQSKGWESWVDLYCLKIPQGCSGGYNLGIKEARKHQARNVILLNNDTIVQENFVSDLIATLLSQPKIALAGVQVRCWPQQEQIWFSKGGIYPLLGFVYRHRKPAQGMLNEQFIPFCAVMIPLEVFDTVGLLDERFFVSFEDLDFCARARRAGWGIAINNDKHIFHKGSATTGDFYSPTKLYYYHRNRMLYFMKHLKGIEKILFIILQWGIVIPCWFLAHLLLLRFDVVRYSAKGYTDFLKGRFGEGA